MPTFMDWLDGFEEYLELGMVAIELGLNRKGQTMEEISKSMVAVNLARMLYNHYIDATQIEELGAEGVGE